VAVDVISEDGKHNSHSLFQPTSATVSLLNSASSGLLSHSHTARALETHRRIHQILPYGLRRNLQARAFYNDTDDVDQYGGNSCERFHDSTSRKPWLLQGKEEVEVRLVIK
jgi:hypothetical protein